tara:strand:- start:251 stop:496 length:246 start_codon:yes stop_codon:yes gene_type:complete
MEVEVTMLEEAVLDAQDIAAGLALSAKIQELIERGEECRIGFTDRELPREVRAEALKEAKEINQQLALVATLREVNEGIEA